MYKLNKKKLTMCTILRIISPPPPSVREWDEGEARGANQLVLFSSILWTVCHWFRMHKGHIASISQHASTARVDPDSSAMKERDTSNCKWETKLILLQNRLRDWVNMVTVKNIWIYKDKKKKVLWQHRVGERLSKWRQ